jgi:hypothetical protein
MKIQIWLADTITLSSDGFERTLGSRLDFNKLRSYHFRAVPTNSDWRASNLKSRKNEFASAVKTFTTIREPLQNRGHIYALAVMLLAFGLFAQAVHAKNSDYFPDSSQSVRFSTTIKIADLAHHVVLGREVLSVTHALLPLLAQPQIASASFDSESASARPAEKVSFRPLRSPPATL